MNFKKILRIILFSLFFIFIIVYAFFRSKELIFGVKIKDVNLNNYTTVNEEIIKIRGNAKNAIKLMINGREIYIDQKGNFEEDFAFLSGYNIISIQAQDKFGHTDEKNYKLMYIK